MDGISGFSGPARIAAVTLVDPAGLAPLSRRVYRWVIVGGLGALLPTRLRRRAARRVGNGTILETELMRLGLAARSFRRPVTAVRVGREASVSGPRRVLPRAPAAAG